MFLISPQRKRSWRYLYRTLLLLSCSNLALSTKNLVLRETIPAPIVIPASQDWCVSIASISDKKSEYSQLLGMDQMDHGRLS